MNAKIESCRQTALKILNPSPKDLEHGLELHKESLVWDSYGFAPRGSYDSEKLHNLADQNASYEEFRNEVEESNSLGFWDNEKAVTEYKEAWEASGVSCIFQNAGKEGNSIPELLKRFSRFTYLADSQRDFYTRAVFPDDVENAHKNGLKTLYLTTNGVPLPFSWQNEYEALYYLKVFFMLGCRMMHLTYNRRNVIGDGCAEEANGGLSEFGKSVVRKMNKVGIIPDVAHCGLLTGLETAQISTKPVVASHAICHEVSPHCRAKTNEVIKALADSGGYIGICTAPVLLRKSGDIKVFLENIDHVVKTFGADYVAIGTDHAYSITSEPLEKSIKCRRDFESFWPEGSLDPKYQADPMHDSLAWTNWPLFTVGMVQMGYKDEDIKKIIGLNVMRVAKETLKK